MAADNPDEKLPMSAVTAGWMSRAEQWSGKAFTAEKNNRKSSVEMPRATQRLANTHHSSETPQGAMYAITCL